MSRRGFSVTPGRRVGRAADGAGPVSDDDYSTARFLFGVAEADVEEARFFEGLEERDRFDEMSDGRWAA